MSGQDDASVLFPRPGSRDKGAVVDGGNAERKVLPSGGSPGGRRKPQAVHQAMKATETKGAPTRQHRAAEGSTAAHEQETAFFPEHARETPPFFQASFLPAGRAESGRDRVPFFRPAGAQLLRSRPAPAPAIRRTPAFESEPESAPEGGALLQRVPAFESGAEANEGRLLLLRQKQTEVVAEGDVPRETDQNGRGGSAAASDDGDDGGAATQPPVQARLTVGLPGDRFEREADAVADQVVSMPRHQGGPATGVQTKPLPIARLPWPRQELVGPTLPRPAHEPQERVQRQESDGPTASADVASRLRSRRGGGRGLDEGTRLEMESAIGADFSGVRIHTDGDAAQLSQDLGAKAFTHGSDIYFNDSQYDPDSSDGKRLLAHELTHTVQQGASIQRKVAVSVGGAPAIQRLPGFVKRGINWLAERIIPGYTLLNVILGKNLITGQTVARSGVNLIRGYMRLSPVIGSILLSQLEETETLPEAGRWVEGKVAEFGIDFNDIARRLRLMWDEMSIWKGVKGNVRVFKKHLGPVIGKFLAFSGVVMQKVKELRFEGALRLVGATELLAALKQDPAAFKRAVENPVAILKQFISGALRAGFTRFKDNFITHFKNALLGWLFGKAAEMGVEMPKKFDVSGVFSLVAQLLGLTYQRIRAMVVKRLGPKGETIVTRLEQTVALVKDLVTRGPIALWERVKSFLTNLKEMLFSKIATLVSTEIIKAAVTKLVSMLNPAGALVQLALTLYRVVKFFIDQWETIKSVAQGILNAIAMVALNKIGPAAAFVERVLAQGMKLIIAFLARIFGLGGIADKVKALIKKISAPVQKAVGKVVSFIVKQGKALVRVGAKGLKKVKEGGKAALAKLGLFKLRKGFKNKGGEAHTLTFKPAGESAELMIASGTPVEVKKYLDTMENNPSVMADPTMKAAVKAGKRLLSDRLRVIIRGKMGKKGKEEKKKLRELRKVLDEIGKELAKLAGNPAPPKDPKYSMPNKKPKKVTAKLLHQANIERGSGTPSGPNTGVTGWKQAFDEGLTTITDGWAQMHLINRDFGGDGKPENLVPGPGGVNTGPKQTRFDNLNKKLLKQPANVIWIDVDVSYRSGTARDKNGDEVDLSQYAQRLELASGMHVPDGKDWNKESPAKVKTTITVPPPPFGEAAEKPKIVLNKSTGTQMRRSGVAVFSEYPTLFKFIKRERPFETYDDLSTKLTTSARRGQSKIPVTDVGSIVAALRGDSNVSIK